MTKKNFLLFLGAGVSQEALGGVSTERITSDILESDKYYRSTIFNPSGCYYVYDDSNDISNMSPDFDTPKKIRKILSYIIKSDILASNDANYEDVYNVLWQLKSHYDYKFINPLLKDFTSRLESKACEWMLYENPKNDNLKELKGWIDEASKYVADVIKLIIFLGQQKSSSVGDRNCLKVLLEKDELKAIATLNYDNLIERYILEVAEKSFDDGFGILHPNSSRDKIVNIGEFGKSLNEGTCSSISLLKLHGSINWYKYKEKAYRVRFDRSTIPVCHNNIPYKYKNDSHLLIGTYNKIVQYYDPVFLTIHHAFWRVLQDTDVVVFSGYSFKDEGVNALMSNWYNHTKRIVVIDPADNIETFKKKPCLRDADCSRVAATKYLRTKAVLT